MLAKSFVSIFNNGFLNTIERVRRPHLVRVMQKLRAFAARVPAKYRSMLEKALQTEGFLSFLLARASVGLLCAKASVPPDAGRGPAATLAKEHEDLATVVEQLYIAATLHAEEQWDMELKADGKSFVDVATSFVKHMADPTLPERRSAMGALLSLDANPLVWTQYGLDLLGLSLEGSWKSISGRGAGPEPRGRSSLDRQKVSLLGGDSLYATAQWAVANVGSRPARKVIAKTIERFSDGQLRKRELVWRTDLSIRQYLDLETSAGIAAFFGASCACAALVNEVEDDIAQQLAEFGSDIGLVVGLLKDAREVAIRSALKLGRMSAPVICALQHDLHLRVLLERQLSHEGDFEQAVARVMRGGLLETIRLVNRLGFRAAARLECLEESDEKEALQALTRGISCLPSVEGLGKDQEQWLFSALDLAEDPAGSGSSFSRNFHLKIENLRLRAKMQRLRSKEKRTRERLESIRECAEGAAAPRVQKQPLVGLGLEFDSTEVDWLLYQALGRQAPVPERLDLEELLRCISKDQAEVQRRLLDIGDAAESEKLKTAVREAFSAGGKRLRPALCLLVHRLGHRLGRPVDGLANSKVLCLATAIEVIHTASLVHDDILDDAETRRQRQAIHKIFGPDVAVLSGDFLFAHASGLVESLEDDEAVRLVSLVIEELGYGELSQSARRFDLGISLFEYLKKSYYKTASLLAAACRASAVLSSFSRRDCDMIYSYGFYLGIAFQITDDVLDFVAADTELGKPACQDLREGHLTAPVILYLQGDQDLGASPGLESKSLAEMVQRRFAREGDFERAVELVRDGGGIEMAYRLAERMANKALEVLILVAPERSDARAALAGLTRWAVQRRA